MIKITSPVKNLRELDGKDFRNLHIGILNDLKELINSIPEEIEEAKKKGNYGFILLLKEKAKIFDLNIRSSFIHESSRDKGIVFFPGNSCKENLIIIPVGSQNNSEEKEDENKDKKKKENSEEKEDYDIYS